MAEVVPRGERGGGAGRDTAASGVDEALTTRQPEDEPADQAVAGADGAEDRARRGGDDARSTEVGHEHRALGAQRHDDGVIRAEAPEVAGRGDDVVERGERMAGVLG